MDWSMERWCGSDSDWKSITFCDESCLFDELFSFLLNPNERFQNCLRGIAMQTIPKGRYALDLTI